MKTMPSAIKRLAILERVRADLARGPMTDAECRDFDTARAYEMHRAELRRHPELTAPQLTLSEAA